MVYGYSTNEEFIDKSYQLLEKLEAKGLWNKDTLVIGLDKSVRPLAYALRKLSSVEGRETPDIRFFRFSSQENYSNIDEISKRLEKEFDSNKLSKYRNVLILDEHSRSGASLADTKRIFNNYFSQSKNKPQIYLSALGKIMHDNINKDDLIYVDRFAKINKAKSEDTGIEDKYGIEETMINKKMQKSIPVQDKVTRQKFLQNRYQLSKDIKNYLHEKHPEKVSEKNKGLERIISGIFVFSFLAGLFFSFGNLTGNVIGNSGSFHKLLGIILVLVGIGGFFVYRKLKRYF